MSRVRIGIAPDAWRDEGPARPTRVTSFLSSAATNGYAVTGGSLVTGDGGQYEQARAQQRAFKARRRAEGAA